jgi:hypothetical protein
MHRECKRIATEVLKQTAMSVFGRFVAKVRCNGLG